MKTRTKLAVAVSAALWLIPISQAVAGIDFNAGDWKVDVSGNVNAFYVGADCDNGPNTAIIGGLACTGNRSAAVRNGLLPAALVFSATSRQGDYDVGVTIGLYPGIHSSASTARVFRRRCKHRASTLARHSSRSATPAGARSRWAATSVCSARMRSSTT
jgi:hypothetical protein